MQLKQNQYKIITCYKTANFNFITYENLLYS